jgi:hypothetical protein
MRTGQSGGLRLSSRGGILGLPLRIVVITTGAAEGSIGHKFEQECRPRQRSRRYTPADDQGLDRSRLESRGPDSLAGRAASDIGSACQTPGRAALRYLVRAQLGHSRLRIAKRRSSVHSPFDHVLSTRCPSWRIPTASSILAEGALRASHEAVTRCLPR